MRSEAVVYSFPEYTCWNDEDFRYSRKAVVFRVFSVGEALGREFDVEIPWDYGIWYHQHDELVIQRLSQSCPGVSWGTMIYHRSWDLWSIDICDPETDEIVARVEVRQSHTDVADIDCPLGDNVVRMADWVADRMSKSQVDPIADQLISDAG